ncbi:hypothetical protein [Streptomyces melanogenes]|uniref:hypothetical protein n=1 Tax=Streptomyces melanogenes TaxID=67326 RepID=UPI00167C69E7|nr:hypothetical protein [Streptomyces melanogenes]GGP92388.1 hypothetical protein GCM10010278_83110 [Streptomyces melanogenes]
MTTTANGRIAKAAALLLCVCLTSAPSARAAESSVDLVCTGQEHGTSTPGVTNSSQAVDAAVDGVLGTQAEHGSCMLLSDEDALPAPDRAQSARYTDKGTAAASCSAFPFAPAPHTRILTWGDGVTSTFTYDYGTQKALPLAEGEFALVGTITAGRFAGAGADETVDVSALDPAACATPGGVTRWDTPTLLTIHDAHL